MWRAIACAPPESTRSGPDRLQGATRRCEGPRVPPTWKESPMPRMLVAASPVILAVCFAASLAGSARAERPGKGRSLVEIGIGGHTGQFTYPGIVSFGRYQSGEVGGQLSYFRFLSDQWTVGISGGYHAGRLKDEDKGGGVFAGTSTINT